MNAKHQHERAVHDERQLAALVHELRNPLAGVSAAIQLVYGRLPSSDEREILRNALTRLREVDVMLATLLREPKSTSGMHAIDISAASARNSATRRDR